MNCTYLSHNPKCLVKIVYTPLEKKKKINKIQTKKFQSFIYSLHRLNSVSQANCTILIPISRLCFALALNSGRDRVKFSKRANEVRLRKQIFNYSLEQHVEQSSIEYGSLKQLENSKHTPPRSFATDYVFELVGQAGQKSNLGSNPSATFGFRITRWRLIGQNTVGPKTLPKKYI